MALAGQILMFYSCIRPKLYNVGDLKKQYSRNVLSSRMKTEQATEDSLDHPSLAVSLIFLIAGTRELWSKMCFPIVPILPFEKQKIYFLDSVVFCHHFRNSINMFISIDLNRINQARHLRNWLWGKWLLKWELKQL